MSCSPWIRSSLAFAAALAVFGCTENTAPQGRQPAVVENGEQARAPAEEPGGPEFARFVPVGEDEGRFETSIVTYRDAGREVSLISAVHIADAAHYQELQRAFEGHDRVLYELIADESTRPTPGVKRSSGAIGLLQQGLKRGLELEFQLDAIDYTKDNFVHADLTPEGFVNTMEERGETILGMFLRIMGQEAKRVKEMREAREDEEEAGGRAAEKTFDVVSAFRSGTGRHTLRMQFAQMLNEVEAMFAGVEPGEGSVLIEARNARAIEVLEEQMAEGHENLAIYYGAAHMPDMERRLVALGFEKVGQRWLTAWDISKRPDPVRKKRKR